MADKALSDDQLDALAAIRSYLKEIDDALMRTALRQQVTPTAIAGMRLNSNSLILRLDTLNAINAKAGMDIKL